MPSLTDAQLQQLAVRTRGLRIIHLALGMGVLAFAGVLALIWRNQPPVTALSGAVELSTTLSYVHVAVAIGVCSVALFLYGKQTAPEALKFTYAERGLEAMLGQLQTAMILRAALFESAALFGEVVVVLSITNGALAEQHLLALNLLSSVVFLGALVSFVPDADALQQQVTELIG